MRWLLPAFLVLTLTTKAQTVGQLLDGLGQAFSQELDIYDFDDPDFNWNMEGRVQASLNEGINFLKENQPNLALPELEKAVELSPKLWVAQYYRGVCLKQMNRFGPAASSLHIADELNPNNHLILIELGKSNDLMGNFAVAERYYQLAGKANPKSPLPLYFLGNHHLSRNDIASAKKAYRNSIEIDSMSLDAEVKLGLLVGLEKLKNQQVAILKYLNNVLRKDSMHQQALIFHGLLSIDTDIKGSVKDWDKLVQLHPGNPRLRMIRGVARAKAGMYDEAFSDIRRFIESLDANGNRFQGRQTMADQAVNLTYAGYYVMANIYGLPDEDALRVRKAYCHLFLSEYNQAIAHLGAVKNGNKSPLILFLQALAFEHKKDHQKALIAYSEALKLDNDILDAHKKRGIYFSELKQWKKATADFTEMLRINPETYFAYRLRGVSLFHDNDLQGAVSDFTKFIERDSLDREVWTSRGTAYLRLGNVLPATYDFIKARDYLEVPSRELINQDLDKLLSNGDTTKAYWWMDKFIEADKFYDRPYIVKIDMLVKHKKWKEIEQQVNQLMPLDSTERIMQVYDEAMAETPGGIVRDMRRLGQGTISFLFAARADAYTNLGKPDLALAQLENVLKLQKKNSFLFLARGKAHLALKNNKEAAKDLRKSKSLGNDEAASLLAQMQ